MAGIHAAAAGAILWTCDCSSMIFRLHSALVEVADLETATHDYARMLGADPVRIERRNGDAALGSAFFGLSNMALELRETPAGELAGRRAGQAGIGLATDAEDPLSILAQRGVDVSKSVTACAQAEAGLAERSWSAHAIDLTRSRGIPVELITEETPEIAALEPVGLAGIDPDSRVRSLDHVVVMSADAEATRSFYQEGLGLRLALDKTFEKRGVRLLFFRVGGTTIEIGARVGAEPKPFASDRFGGLAWKVPDIDAVRARLAADRFDVSEVRTGHKPGTRVCTVRDPVHSVPTLLIEPVDAEQFRTEIT